MLNSKVGKVHYPNVTALKFAIMKAYEELPEKTVHTAVAKVPVCLHAVLNAQMGNSEKCLKKKAKLHKCLNKIVRKF